MSASKLRLFGVALLLAAGAATRAQAQLDDPNSPFYGPSNDLQWFEPVDLDLDGRGLRDRAGFFFRYEKLYWSVGGERVEVGGSRYGAAAVSDLQRRPARSGNRLAD